MAKWEQAPIVAEGPQTAGLTVAQRKALALARARLRREAEQNAPASGPWAKWQSAPLAGEEAPSSGPWEKWRNDPIVEGAGQRTIDYIKNNGLPGYGNIAFADKAVESIPVIGPWVNDRLSDIRGGASDLINNTFGTDLPNKQAMDESISIATKGSPTEATAGEVFGSTAPLALAGMTGVGSRLLGMTGSLGWRVGAGAGTGLALSGADTLARGGSAEDAMRNGAIGAAVGGALPIAERLAGVVMRAITGKALDPAETALVRALKDDGIPIEEVNARIQQFGPEAVLADLGPNLQRQAGALASLPGEGQKLVRETLANRAAGTNARISGEIDATLGPATTPMKFEAGIKAQKKTLSPFYEKALNGSTAVDTQDVALDLDSLIVNTRGEAQSRAKTIRDMLNVVGTNELDPNPRTLLSVRQAIDDMYTEGLGGNAKRVLTDMRTKIDGILAQAAPGIKVVDEEYANLSKQQEAFDTGQTILDSSRASMRPADVEALVQSSAPDVVASLSAGTRAEIDRIIGTTTNNLKALQTALKGDGSWNRDRLATLFGADKADRLMAVLEREKGYAATHNIVSSNSEAAARTAAQAELDAGTPQVLRDTTLTGLMASGAQKLANIGVRSRRSSINSKVAEALMSRQVNQPKLSEVAKALLKKGVIAPAAVPLLLTGGQGNARGG